jgi:hypothetical protein
MSHIFIPTKHSNTLKRKQTDIVLGTAIRTGQRFGWTYRNLASSVNYGFVLPDAFLTEEEDLEHDSNLLRTQDEEEDI